MPWMVLYADMIRHYLTSEGIFASRSGTLYAQTYIEKTSPRKEIYESIQHCNCFPFGHRFLLLPQFPCRPRRDSSSVNKFSHVNLILIKGSTILAGNVVYWRRRK